MQNINNSISFTGSRKFLRDADWVCRKVKSEFPMISPTRVYYSNMEKVQSDKKYMSFIMKKSIQLQEDRADRHFLSSAYKFMKEVLFSVTVNKVGNCSEYVSLAEMISKMNGVKNCYRLSLVDANPKNISNTSKKKLDHTVLMISKNPVEGDTIKPDESLIIDPWLGISGRMKDVVSRYKLEFSKMLKITDDTEVAFKISRPLNFKDFEIETFKLGFPNLIYPKNDETSEFMKII